MTPHCEIHQCPDCADSRRGRCAQCRGDDREDAYEAGMADRRENRDG